MVFEETLLDQELQTLMPIVGYAISVNMVSVPGMTQKVQNSLYSNPASPLPWDITV